MKIKEGIIKIKYLFIRIKSNFLKKKIKKIVKNKNFNEFKELIKKKNFNNYWFLNNFNLFEFFLSEKKNTNFKYLEVGSYEGMSALYIAHFYKNSEVHCIDMWKNTDNTLTKLTSDMDKIEKNFDNNLMDYKIFKVKSDSLNALKKYQNNKEVFDCIYIDGSHDGLDIFSDAIESFKILKKNGILIFDDIDISENSKNFSQFEAIDAFKKMYNKKIKFLFFKRVVFIKKIENEI